MAIPVLIIGKSGSGKSTSMRNLNPEEVALINVLGKPLPFKNGKNFPAYKADDAIRVGDAIQKTSREIVVVDDAGYIMTNMFMRGHAQVGSGNAQFMFYNNIADNYWNVVETAKNAAENKRVYFIMHEEMNDMGHTKPKTIGKLLDEKLCLEGMFTICLRCMVKDGKHIFRTQSDGFDVAKTPMGMFEQDEIDNDLAMVDKAICEYYGIGGKENV